MVDILPMSYIIFTKFMSLVHWVFQDYPMEKKPILVLAALFALLTLALAPSLAQNTEQPSLVVIAGTIQSVLGCPGDWQPDCEATALTYDAEDDLWSAVFRLPAGSYEYKAALNGSWDLNYGANAQQNGPNIPLVLEQDADVRFIYSTATHWVTDNINSYIVNVPGNYQDEIGCGEWQPSCLRSLLQDPDGDGIYTFQTDQLPAGAYEAKVAANESWSLNWGLNGARDGANIPFFVNEDNQLVEFSWDSSTFIMTIVVGGEAGPAVGNLLTSIAQWVTEDTILWNIGRIPGANYRLHFSADGSLDLGDQGITGGDFIPLTYDRRGMTDAIVARFPHLQREYFALRIAEADLPRVPEILKGQLALSATYNTPDGEVLQDATGVQIAGVLDDLYFYDGDLGVLWDGDIPTLRVWAPTARSVSLHLFDAEDSSAALDVLPMTAGAHGTWEITGTADWNHAYYLYEVEVYVPSTRSVERNIVTDPYSLSLAANSTRSQIVNLSIDGIPEGWREHSRPSVTAPEDIVLYELHIRDFSIIDESVPAEHRGTYMAFTHPESNGMRHLRALAEAGLTHVHLLPTFDIATINEIASERQEADREALAALPPDSDEQQAILEPLRDLDGFNWGYDPYHYTAPEGSYSTDPEGLTRIEEFRQMVQSLHEAGLHVVMDVVYNHTSEAGQGQRSVLDRIVPGYYHRLSLDGRIETSTCCQNTATEHLMMEKLMIDSAVTWVTQYGIDGFRFDLMGHHMLSNMINLRERLDALTLEDDGVDGSRVYIYGEGWNFGEVANNARGINATQLNIGGTGIGTFTDRLRDAVRGGSPFGGWQEQGFSNGLYTYPNEVETRSEADQLQLLLHFQDMTRLGLAGNLRDYPIVRNDGEQVTGADISYNGAPAGYALDPQETITYVSAHDNETIFDAIQMKAPLSASIAERVRMHNLAYSIVLLSQGVPFIHAGDDLLRSKSMDRNSYNSGDWFNAIDWTGETGNWGIGLPPAGDNRDNYDIMRPLLGNPALAPTQADRLFASAVLREFLEIRFSSPLFRLRTAEDIFERVTFTQIGELSVPGVIVMHLSDTVGEDLDPAYQQIVVLINASPDTVNITEPVLEGTEFALHPVQANGVDSVVQGSLYDASTGTFTIPPLTTAVFVLGE
jgi:pullulanase-type alpha-1,6-glucosidase